MTAIVIMTCRMQIDVDCVRMTCVGLPTALRTRNADRCEKEEEEEGGGDFTSIRVAGGSLLPLGV